MANRGFMPCFSYYKNREYPIDSLYNNGANVEKVKNLLSCLVDSESPGALKKQIGKDINPLRPDSQEGKRLIRQFEYHGQLYRIDYGNTPFRIVFGLSNSDRLAHILAIDLTHETFSGKQRN
jgi:hypothetical protein